MVAVSELVSGLDAELVRLGYKPSTMVWYRGCWRRLERFFASRGVQEFSLDLAMAWVDQACGGFFDKEQAGTLKPTDVYLFRVAQMLDDFAVHGAVLRRYSRTVGRLTADRSRPSPGSRHGCGPPAAPRRRCDLYGTVGREFLAFPAHVAAGSLSTPARIEAFSSPRSRDSVAAIDEVAWFDRCSGSRPAMGLSMRPFLDNDPGREVPRAHPDPVGTATPQMVGTRSCGSGV